MFTMAEIESLAYSWLCSPTGPTETLAALRHPDGLSRADLNGADLVLFGVRSLVGNQGLFALCTS
jgi:hypothetical protein